MGPYNQGMYWLAKQNIENLINKKFFPKIIRFGKVTFIDAPVTYNIGNGSKESNKYNKFHRHWAYEIRDIKGTKQWTCTDTNLVGFCLKTLDSMNK